MADKPSSQTTGAVIALPQRTYRAKPFRAGDFLLSGTLDGYIDFALPECGTYQLSLDEARALIAALNGAICDVRDNCLYDRDVLLEKDIPIFPPPPRGGVPG